MTTTTQSSQSTLGAVGTVMGRVLAGAIPFRFRFLGLSVLAILFALLTLGQANSAYDTSYELFRGIVEVNSTTVDAAESALQYIARSSQAAADYALLTSDTPLYEQAQNNIFRNFSSYRDEMAILQGNLQSDDEITAYITAETLTYSRFWRHVSNLVAQRSDDAVARREYLDADNHVLNWINPALQELERVNYDQMVLAGEQAGSAIFQQLVGFAIFAIILAALLVYISFQLRGKLKRYITPGIDIALVLSLAFLAATVIQLLDAPSKINAMIEDSYRNVSASSRTLVDANLANRTESSALIDIERTDSWYARFDSAAERIELRICGFVGCTADSLLSASGVLRDSSLVMSAEDAAKINNIPPLVSNLHSRDEELAIEQARVAFRDFLSAHDTLRAFIDAGDMDNAIAVNTNSDIGTSQEAFDRFESAMTQIITVNRQEFDAIYEAQSSALQRNQAIIGVIGYILIGLLIGVGVVHRFREL